MILVMSEIDKWWYVILSDFDKYLSANDKRFSDFEVYLCNRNKRNRLPTMFTR